MYMPDLVEYQYNGRFLLPGVQAVGWLAASHPFEEGELGIELVDKLVHLAVKRPINQARGYHRCDLCSATEVLVEATGTERLLGSAEIWIPGRETLFASPDLIVHYVREHRYLPPPVYIAALQAVELGAWNPPRDYGLDLFRKSLGAR